jgi:hypothetical protein
MNLDPNRPEDEKDLENAEEQVEDKFLDEEPETTEDESPVEEEQVEDEQVEEPVEEEFPFDAGTPMGEMPEMEGPPPTNFDMAYPQLFFFLFCSLAIAVGCLLPWERTYLKGNLTGADSIGGGFLLVFAIYGVLSGFFNIYHRKMIVWPVLLAGIEGAIIGWQRVVQILGSLDKNRFITTDDEFGKVVQTVKGYVQSMGPGLYLVTIFSTLVLLSIIVSVFKGAKEEGRRKAEEREARAEARRSRRPS